MVLPVALFTSACSTDSQPATVTITDVPFEGDGAGMPWLTTLQSGDVAMSWIRTEDGIPRLEYARYGNGGWSAPGVIARQTEGEEWFVNWADFPSIVELTDGRLAAHYLVSSDDHIFAYDVHIRKQDVAGTWQQAIVPHTDGTKTEHGFVSLLPREEGSLMAVWLDGRKMAGGGEAHTGHDHASQESGPMTLRAAVLDGSERTGETELDGMVCDCCLTSAVNLPGGGVLVAYRDRTREEIRDISIVRYRNGNWEQPRVLHHDGWEIGGCPVNGPALDAIGETVAVAWFTHPGETPKVRVAFSGDGGDSWTSPIDANDGFALGRVDIVLLDENRALLSWIDHEERDARIMVRVVHRNGELGAPVVVSTDEGLSARAAGFPRMAKFGTDQVMIAWTAVEGGQRSVQVRKFLSKH
jgi:hypothetical protein